MGHAVGGAAGVGGEYAARGCAFAQFDAGVAQGGGEPGPVLALPARRIGLLARDAAQGVGADRAGAQGTRFRQGWFDCFRGHGARIRKFSETRHGTAGRAGFAMQGNALALTAIRYALA